MNAAMAKGTATFFSIAIVVLLSWAVVFCCCLAYYRCRKRRVDRHDDGGHTEMTLPKSGIKSDNGECQIQIDQPSAV